jgi:hypothetical protein
MGTFLTTRGGEDYHNRVYGMDGLLRFTSKDVLRYQFLGSNTAYSDEVIEDFDQPTGSFNGYGVSLNYNHSRRNFEFWTEYEDLSPELRVDSGFIPRVDTREGTIGGMYVHWGGTDRWFTRLNTGAEIVRVVDHNGRLTDREVVLFFDYLGPMQTFLNNYYVRRNEYYDGTTYDQNQVGFHFNSQPTGSLELWMTGRFGEAIDYDNSRPARRIWGGPGMRYYFGRRLQASYDNTIEELRVNGERLFLAFLNEFRLVYQFNIKTFVRAIVQYEDISRNVDLYDPEDEEEPESRELFTQLLFSYKINPQTVLFIGYSDNHDNEDRNNLTMKDRTFFFKLGYAWVL